MKFIVLTNIKGNKVAINRDSIVMIEHGGYTLVQTTMDGSIYVSEPFDEVLEKLNS